METNGYRIPKTKTGQKSFNQIIRAGKKLFVKAGLRATSVNDIIEKAKIAAGTFYIYFDNKLALYLYLLEEYRISIRKASTDAIIGLTKRHDIERAGLKAFVEYVRKDRLAYKVIWESLFVDINIFRQYYQTFAESYMYHLNRAVDKGEVRNDIDLETLSFMLMGIANFVGLQVLFRETIEEPEIDRIIDEAMKMLDDGMFLHAVK